ncbi:Heat shock 70 kDa protein 1-like [Hypsibius exemplaris]|uniref:Heat shock 70 kDa protein 1-like n=1 Tax=Hypsibius exemplaris TaxID=2072580 RepID=A0A1W0X9U7_HYPEX|nr:Heat shock 70 kDa protein 1-like [Hypsibius exemplaris]
MSIPEPSAIGIDLGTTNCCVAVFRNGRCEAVPSGNGSTTIPSYVAFEDDHCVVGQEAKDNAFGHPKGTIFAVKRILGHRYSEVEDGVRLSQRWPFALTADENGFAAVRLPDDCGMTKVIWKPEEVSGELLKHLKELAQDFLGCPVQRAVITVPASFTEHQRRCTLAAGIMAGLEVVGIVNEPTAAAIAYGLQTPAGENEKTRIILVCDFGGGTIDVSIISAVGRSTFQVLGTSGNMHLGGEDFDDCLVEELLLRWEELHGPGIRQSPAAMTRLRKQAQQVKHTLATGTEENAGVVLASLFGGVDFRTTVSRTTFEKVCGHLFQQALEPIETAMRLTNMRKQDLSHIVLVGGSSRMRVFRDMPSPLVRD